LKEGPDQGRQYTSEKKKKGGGTGDLFHEKDWWEEVWDTGRRKEEGQGLGRDAERNRNIPSQFFGGTKRG